MFTYRLIPPVSQPISVTVSYVDLSGNRVASDTVFMAGEGKNAVQPVPSDLLEGYSLAPGEDAVKYVTVVNNAAQPVSLTFLYEKRQETTPTPVPPPKAALVSVLYRSEAGDVLFSENVPCKEGEQTLIAVDLSRIDAQHYQLVGQDSAVITLDSSGNPSQKEVVFTFRDTTVKSAVLTLHYRDEAGTSDILARQPGCAFHKRDSRWSLAAPALRSTDTVSCIQAFYPSPGKYLRPL